MNINTRNLGFVNFNSQEMQWINFNGVNIYEACKKLLASGIPPLMLSNSKGDNLVGYKIYGNVEGVGDYDETTEKYKIPITISNDIFKTLKLEQGTAADATGILADSTTRVRTNFIPLDKGTYRLELNWSINKVMVKGVHIYDDETEDWKKYLSFSSAKITFTLTERSKVMIIFNKSQNAEITEDDVLGSDVYFQLGETIEKNEITTNIYLDEPLTINDYIDYKKQQVIRNGVPINIELPNILTIKDITILTVDTVIQPSNMEVVYKEKK